MLIHNKRVSKGRISSGIQMWIVWVSDLLRLRFYYANHKLTQRQAMTTWIWTRCRLNSELRWDVQPRNSQLGQRRARANSLWWVSLTCSISVAVLTDSFLSLMTLQKKKKKRRMRKRRKKNLHPQKVEDEQQRLRPRRHLRKKHLQERLLSRRQRHQLEEFLQPVNARQGEE